ncbi:nuclease-related domain-containing protein [Streptosporangium sp. NPDC049376]|uniref:nuclease-related domain-containing protein n=1 Tax=Streptosporangium sp. NPDC049376 TaxID=3366192 RepID=UPI00378A7506
MFFRPSGTAGAGASAYAQYRAKLAEGRTRRLALRAGLVLVSAIAVWWLWNWPTALLVAVVVGTADTVYRWRRHEAVRTWRKGAIGERRTARMLRPLGRHGYTVLHDRALPSGRANVDHLVIGKTGVFVVDTKNWHRGKRLVRRGRSVRVGGASGGQIVRPVLYEAGRVADTLTRELGRRVIVVPVVAVHGADMPLLRVAKASGVPLLRASQVRGWITRQPATLSAAEIAEVSATAERLLPPYTT